MERDQRTSEQLQENYCGNPVLPGWYADPEIHIFNKRYYMYPTTSIAFDQQTYFEVWSSDDMAQWQNEGHMLELRDISWGSKRAAWAPSVCYRNSQYYGYFSVGDGDGIGVATARSPVGPFIDALGRPLVKGKPQGAQPIDADVFIDDDEKAFLYFGGHGHAVVAELNEDMTSFKSDFHELMLPNYVEGSFIMKRNGMYYFFWSEGDWNDATYAVSYATGNSPLGPFDFRRKILQSDQNFSGPGHCSIVKIPTLDEWYMAYHRRDIKEQDPNNRQVCIEQLHFDTSGLLLPITMTTIGVKARPLKAAA